MKVVLIGLVFKKEKKNQMTNKRNLHKKCVWTEDG